MKYFCMLSRYQKTTRNVLTFFLFGLFSSILIGCGGAPVLGTKSSVSGSAAGASTSGENSNLEKCEQSLGTVSVFEDRDLPWWSHYKTNYPKLGSTIPVIRLMIQQSNCFVIVERGAALASLERERDLAARGVLREGSNLGGGQMVAADYTITPSVLFSEQTGGVGGAVGSVFGGAFKAVAGALKTNEAETNLTLIDNRSAVQVATANGTAKRNDVSLFGGFIGGGTAAGLGGFNRTPEGKTLMASFAESYNEMVRALRNYRPQETPGGLGKGGQLQIGGANDATPQATQPVAIQEKSVVVAPLPQTNLVAISNRSQRVRLDQYDESAMEDYVDSLKSSVEHMGTFSTFTKEQVDQLEKDSKHALTTWGVVFLLGGPFANKLETAQIELEEWPLSARRSAWQTYGNRIEKYNRIFERHRQNYLKNNAFSQDLLNQLAAFQLLTKESLLRQ